MAMQKIVDYLDAKRVKYLLIQHSPAFTAQELASKMHVHGWDLAKTTVLKRPDGSFVMAVLPAPSWVDLAKMATLLEVERVELATEEDLARLFPDCEIGAMPPFGNLFGLPVFVDEELGKDPSIIFCAGAHDQALRMDFVDFRRLVEPTLASFSTGAKRRPKGVNRAHGASAPIA